MADSSQKILKELSDMTRNLDVLAKEIRSMNKNTASVQDAVIKSIDKKEAANDKIEKSSGQDSEKVISETKKKQDGMFSKLLETIRKNSEAGNKEIKKAGLEGIKAAGKNLLETKSLKSAAKSGLGSIIKTGESSIVDAIRRKKEEKKSAEAESVTSTEGLKQKERVKKEEVAEVAKESSERKTKEAEKKEKKSILEKLNIKKKTEEEKSKKEKEKNLEGKSEEKTEKKGLLSKIREKISSKDTKKEDIISKLGKERIDQKDSFLDSVMAKVQEKKDLPSLKSITTGITPEKKQEEKISLKDRSKQIFQKTTLGSTIKSFSDVIKRKKAEDNTSPSSIKSQPEKLSFQSKVEKSGTELKPRSRSKKKESSAKEKSEVSPEKEVSVSSSENKPKESKTMEKNSEPKYDSKKNDQDKEKTPEISAQDIADIKSLLASINSTLNGPLNIKDNKPYRPHSNMLE